MLGAVSRWLWSPVACLACSVAASTSAGAAPGSAPAAAVSPAELRGRFEAYRPFDGSGRYTLDREDGTRGVQGLVVLANRFSVKPYQELSTSPGVWRTERTIFRDTDTGAVIMRMTNDRWADQLSYFQGNWSADGRTIVFRRRPGMWEGSTATHGPMAMNADGTGLRNVFRDYPMVRGEVCSPSDPNICYAMTDSDRKVIAFDLGTGKTHHVVHEGDRNWHLKISPDGKYLMSRSDLSKGGKGLWTASADGKEQYEIPIPEAIHDSYHFHPTQRKILFWYEGKFRDEGFVQCDFDGANRVKVPVQFDWNHGDFGIDRGVHCEGYITMVEGNTWGPRRYLFHAEGVEYYDDPADANGYSTWWPKDEPWAYHTRIVHRPAISEIFAARCEVADDAVANRYRVCHTALQRGQCLDNPNASPDGTKVLFNSNFLGAVNIFSVVARLPQRPTDLSASETTEGVKLAWTAPRHHAEIAGYHLYRSDRSGIEYRPITTQPISGTSFVRQRFARRQQPLLRRGRHRAQRPGKPAERRDRRW